MTANGSSSRRRGRRTPSFELEINGTMRHVPAPPSPSPSSASERDSEDGARLGLLPAAGVAAGAAAPGRSAGKARSSSGGGGGGGSKKKQQHGGSGGRESAPASISAQEWGNMALLVLLYAMQGIPLGLTMGAMPFLLQSKLSMTQMGLFSMSGYPYSFKLLWSPIVDSVYSAAFGRRKSWIVPVQLASAALLVTRADWIQAQYEAGGVGPLTVLFFFFVLLAATQDIAVDGWALTLLPPHHIEYASTCQTLGMNSGYFMSFTIFLALSNPAFCNTYVRGTRLGAALGLRPSEAPLVTLRGYVAFWGCAFTLITLAVALFKQEGDHYAEAAGRADWRHHGRHGGANGRKQQQQQQQQQQEGGGGAKALEAGGAASSSEWAARRQEIASAYVKLWGVVCLPAIWALSFLLVTYRLGVLPAESAAALKLLDKGVAKEALAALVLVQFPVELASAVIAGRWASSHSPYQPFVAGYFVRLLMAVCLTSLAGAFPPGASSFLEHRAWFGALSAIGLVTSFSSTLMFTALGSFFNRISDPGMGGAYLTLLNTIANMGVILPKTPLFAAMDWLTASACKATSSGGAAGATATIVKGLACPKKIRLLAGSSPCTDAGHTCVMLHDGFYVVSYCSVVLGLLLGGAYMRLFPRLIALPLSRWRAAPARASPAA